MFKKPRPDGVFFDLNIGTDKVDEYEFLLITDRLRNSWQERTGGTLITPVPFHGPVPFIQHDAQEPPSSISALPTISTAQ
jgi:hypothetical protein